MLLFFCFFVHEVFNLKNSLVGIVTIVIVFRFMTKYDSEINLFELRVDQQHSFNFIWGKLYLSILIYHFIIAIFNFIFGYTKSTVELIFRTVGGDFCFLTLFPLYVWFMVFKLTARIKQIQWKKKNYWFGSFDKFWWVLVISLINSFSILDFYIVLVWSVWSF